MRSIIALAAVIGLSTIIQLEPDSRVWVEGGSTVRNWSCQAEEFTSALNSTGASDISALIDGAVITIPVGRLECGNGTMNDHMRKALKTGQNPNIEFRMKSYRITADQAVMQGTLTMAGVTKHVEIAGFAKPEGSLIRVKGSKQLTMSQWGVRPPSLMLGTMKVKDDVTVGFDVTLKR